MNILYFNGLGAGKLRKREEPAIRYLSKHGHNVVHGHVNWYEERPLDGLLAEKELEALKLLQTGNLAIVGASAGVSLAFNVMARLANLQGAYAIGLCGRIRPGNFKDGSRDSLRAAANFGTERESKLFYESVTRCPASLDKLGSQTNRLTIVTQVTDLVVPPSTRLDDRIDTRHVAGIGHGMGIAMGVLVLPEILSKIEQRST